MVLQAPPAPTLVFGGPHFAIKSGKQNQSYHKFMPHFLQHPFSSHYERKGLWGYFSTPHGSLQRQNLGFAAPQIPSLSRLSVAAHWPGWVCATARVLLTPELQQGCKGLSYSNPSAAHPLASPTALLLSIMWEPQGGFAAPLFLLWQLSRVSAARGAPSLWGLNAATELGPSTSTANLLGLWDWHQDLSCLFLSWLW